MDIAFGPLNLTTEQFWEMTPVEIERLAEGYKWRNNREKNLIAWQTSLLMNIHLSEDSRVSIEQLLGLEEIDPAAKEMDEDEKRAELAKVMEALEERKRAKQQA